MKTFLFLIACQLLCISCVYRDHERPAQLKMMPTAPAPWEVEFVGSQVVRFQNGDTMGIALHNMDYIGQLPADVDSLPPFLILSGRECEECDANKYIFVHSPANGDLANNRLGQKYPYPGKALAHENGELVNDCRFFFGEVLPGVVGGLWYQQTLQGKKMVPNGLLVRIKGGQAVSQVLKGENMPVLDSTLALVAAGKALELPGETYYTEP